MRKSFRLLFVLFLVFAWCTTFAQKEEINPAAKSIREAGINHLPITMQTNMTDYLNEGFEGGVVPPSGWTTIIQNASYNWKLHDFDPYAGMYAADVEYDDALVPQNIWLISS